MYGVWQTWKATDNHAEKKESKTVPTVKEKSAEGLYDVRKRWFEGELDPYADLQQADCEHDTSSPMRLWLPHSPLISYLRDSFENNPASILEMVAAWRRSNVLEAARTKATQQKEIVKNEIQAPLIKVTIKKKAVRLVKTTPNC